MARVTRTVDLPYPPEMVWSALTDPRQLANWLMENDFRPEVGHRFTFHTDPAPGFDGIVQSEVLVLEPPRRLSLSWAGGSLESVVTFTLTPSARGTRLDLVHDGFASLLSPVRFILGSGWRRLLRRKLPATLARQDRAA